MPGRRWAAGRRRWTPSPATGTRPTGDWLSSIASFRTRFGCTERLAASRSRRASAAERWQLERLASLPPPRQSQQTLRLPRGGTTCGLASAVVAQPGVSAWAAIRLNRSSVYLSRPAARPAGCCAVQPDRHRTYPAWRTTGWPARPGLPRRIRRGQRPRRAALLSGPASDLSGRRAGGCRKPALGETGRLRHTMGRLGRHCRTST